MTRVIDLDAIEIEHLAGPLVKIRCLSGQAILLGQIEPSAAREIAAHLHEAAARAEYEADLYNTMRARGWDAPTIGSLMHLVRYGEAHRHTTPPAAE